MDKRLNSGRRWLAGRLLWLGLVLSSCLLPQNDEPLPPMPVSKNRPPRIDPETAQPGRAIKVNLASNCPPATAEARVDDLDLQDEIRVRWLVYREDGTQQGLSRFDAATITTTTVVQRPRITAPPNVFTLSVLGTTGNGRRLDLVIGDGEFSEDMATGKLTTLPRRNIPLTDGGTTVMPTYLDTYTWVVETVNDSVLCQ